MPLPACVGCFKRAYMASGVSVSVMKIYNVWPLSAGLCTFYTKCIYVRQLEHLQNRLSQLYLHFLLLLCALYLSLGLVSLLSLFLAVFKDPLFISLSSHVEIGKGSRVTKQISYAGPRQTYIHTYTTPSGPRA